MAKFPSHIIERAVDVGFSDEEINKAQKNMALEAFEEEIADREDERDEIELPDNIVEQDMTDRPEQASSILKEAVKPLLKVQGVDSTTLQRFEALCLLKGWGFGEKLTEILEGVLGDEGFRREDGE